MQHVARLRNGLRSFRLDRVIQVDLTPTPFERPEHFDAMSFIAQAVATLPRRITFEVLLKTDLVTAKDEIFDMFGVLEPREDGEGPPPRRGGSGHRRGREVGRQRREIPNQPGGVRGGHPLVDPGSQDITAATIMGQTASYFGLSIEDLCGTSRSRSVREARS